MDKKLNHSTKYLRVMLLRNRPKMMVVAMMLTILLGVSQPLQAQSTTTLTQCIELATQHNALSQTSGLYDQLKQLNLDLVQTNKKPIISLESDASIQSEAMQIDLPLPMNPVSIDLPIYKAKIYGQLLYPILDGHLPDLHTELQNHDLTIQSQQTLVKLYPLKTQVAELFFATQLIDKKNDLIINLKTDLSKKHDQVLNAIKHGVAMPLDAHRLEAEIIKLDNQIREINQQKTSLIAVLNSLTNTQFSTETKFIIDQAPDAERPEYQLFTQSQNKLEATKQLSEAAKKPKLSAFLQGGIGYPNPLNLFDDSFSPYALGGLTFSWPIHDWGRSDKQSQQLDIQKELVQQERSAFTLQQQIVETQIAGEINNITASIEGDKKSLAMQSKIVQEVNDLFKNGVVTSFDYVTEINKKNQIELSIASKELQIQWLQTKLAIQKGW